MKNSEIKTAYIDGQIEAKKEFLPILEEERKQKEEAQIKLAIIMIKYKEPIEKIIKETGLNKEAIEKLMNS